MLNRVHALDVFRVFLNRQSEVDRLCHLFKTSERGRIGGILAGPDSGLSSALRQARRKMDTGTNIIPIDLGHSQQDAVFLQTIEYIVSRGNEFAQSILKPLVRPGKKEILRRMISSSAGAIPIVGAPLSQVSEIAFSLVSPDGDYLDHNKKLAEVFELLTSAGDTCVVIDHFQIARPNHLSQIAGLLNANPRLAVLGAQNTIGLAPSVQLTSDVLQPYLTSAESFPLPDDHLAGLILSHVKDQCGVKVNTNLLPDIRDGLYAFLSKIYEALLNGSEQQEPLEQIHLDILCTLKMADRPMEVGSIYSILVQGGVFVLDTAAFRTAIDVLLDRGLADLDTAGGKNHILMLSSQGGARARQELASGHRDLYFANLLYEGLIHLIDAGRLAEPVFAALLYRLAGIVDVDGQARWQIATIKSCIATSSFFEASAILSLVEASLPDDSDDDILTLISACATTKKYRRALELCQYISKRTVQTSILEAILLYRDLQLDRAEIAMKTLLQSVQDPESLCLLATYYVALRIDLGGLDDVAERLCAEHYRFETTKHYGYLINVIAATQPPTEAIETCRTSFETFRRYGDDFGLGGAQANLGVHLIKDGCLLEAKKVGIEAHEILSQFGIQHIHLVTNNIATSSLLLGDIEDAAHWNRIALNLLQTSTIRVNAFTNLAAIEFLACRNASMIQAIDAAIQQAEQQPIRHVSRKLAQNIRVLLGDIEGMPDTIAQFVHHERSLGLDERDISPLDTQVSRDMKHAHFKQYFIPSTNQYWFPNPMNLFQNKALSVEAYS